jgi:hypothetical protein
MSHSSSSAVINYDSMTEDELRDAVKNETSPALVSQAAIAYVKLKVAKADNWLHLKGDEQKAVTAIVKQVRDPARARADELWKHLTNHVGNGLTIAQILQKADMQALGGLVGTKLIEQVRCDFITRGGVGEYDANLKRLVWQRFLFAVMTTEAASKKHGNCAEQACLAYEFIKSNAPSVAVAVLMDAPLDAVKRVEARTNRPALCIDHILAVVGNPNLRRDAEVILQRDQPPNWPAGAVICDPWVWWDQPKERGRTVAPTAQAEYQKYFDLVIDWHVQKYIRPHKSFFSSGVQKEETDARKPDAQWVLKVWRRRVK